MEDYLNQQKQELQKNSSAYLRIKVIPGAKTTAFAELLESEEPTLKIKISAAPEKGKANKELCQFLGKYFQANAEVMSGQTSQLKLVKLERV